MRLDEITRTTRIPKGNWKEPKGQRLGSGAQGRAITHPKQANVAIKIANVYDVDHDPYVEFVKLALENQDNPFFPRIYKAKLVRMGDSIYQLVLNMERLHNISNPNIADAVVENFKRLGFPQDVADTTTADITKDVVKIRKWLEQRTNRQQLAKTTPNPNFREALTLLEPFLEKFKNDMHAQNWMARLTPSGPQLVIIDPLEF